jgi:hypothetical protein
MSEENRGCPVAPSRKQEGIKAGERSLPYVAKLGSSR